jgi:hypothetical protein
LLIPASKTSKGTCGISSWSVNFSWCSVI